MLDFLKSPSHPPPFPIQYTMSIFQGVLVQDINWFFLCRQIVCAFTTVPWSSAGGYHNDDSAVLFSFDLANPDNIVISRATPGYSQHVWDSICTYWLPVTCLHIIKYAYIGVWEGGGYYPSHTGSGRIIDR